MAENKLHDRPVENAPATHETSEVKVRPIASFAIALVVLCLLALGLMAGLFRFFQSRENAAQAPPRPGAVAEGHRMPPMPRLQSEPIPDLKTVRAAEDAILDSYGWEDQSKGVVRIPVARAMELLARRGLPARPAGPPESAAAGITVPTESALGQIMQQPGGPLAAEMLTPSRPPAPEHHQ